MRDIKTDYKFYLKYQAKIGILNIFLLFLGDFL